MCKKKMKWKIWHFSEQAHIPDSSDLGTIVPH